MQQKLKFKMGKKKSGKRAFVQLEPGLTIANRDIICINKKEIHRIRGRVEQIVEKIIAAMKKESGVFKKLYAMRFGAGSAYENLKIVQPDEMDINILLKLPEIAKPVLYESNIPGHVFLKLEEFAKLQQHDPDTYNVMKNFVDKDNYLLVDKMKSIFMQSIFDRAFAKQNGIVKFGKKKTVIERVQFKGPAMTLSIQATDFNISVDLVPCIIMKPEQWPQNGFRQNPYFASPALKEFFIAPKSPKREMPHIERYWRLSFQKQERQLFYSRRYLKPTVRVLKCIREHFDQQVFSYALKTLFFWELAKPENDTLWNGPFSYCVVYMLDVYLEHLKTGKIPYFWNSRLNLLENLSEESINESKNQIAAALKDIKDNPSPSTILKYLEVNNNH